MGTQLPPQLGTAPHFLADICCGQIAGRIKMPLCMEVGLGPGNFVLDGDPAPLPKKGAKPPPQFGTSLLWPKGWMVKMPLGMEVGLGPDHFELDGDLAPPQTRGTAPNYQPMFVVAKRLDGSRCHLGGGLRPVRTKWYRDTYSRLATIDMVENWGL